MEKTLRLGTVHIAGNLVLAFLVVYFGKPNSQTVCLVECVQFTENPSLCFIGGSSTLLPLKEPRAITV